MRYHVFILPASLLVVQFGGSRGTGLKEESMEPYGHEDDSGVHAGAVWRRCFENRKKGAQVGRRRIRRICCGSYFAGIPLLLLRQ